MMKVGIVIKMMERINDFFLPIKSPRRPKKRPPRGLQIYPKANRERALNKLEVGDSGLKKRLEMVGAQ